MKRQTCKSWVEKTNSRCRKKAATGTSYCWLHFPKKTLWSSITIAGLFGMVVTVLLQQPLVWGLSKIPLFYWLDKDNPIVEQVDPDIHNSQSLEGTTDVFQVTYSEDGSGLDSFKSHVKVLRKDGLNLREVSGQQSMTGSQLSMRLDKPLVHGEYLFQVVLVDRASNMNSGATIPFPLQQPLLFK